IDISDFVTVARDQFRKRPDDKPMFVGLSTAPDKSMTVVGSGPSAEDLQAVSIVLRVRSMESLEDSQRVTQAATIANTITNNNVSRTDLVAWITRYLKFERRTEPEFRNGWRVSVSG